MLLSPCLAACLAACLVLTSPAVSPGPTQDEVLPSPPRSAPDRDGLEAQAMQTARSLLAAAYQARPEVFERLFDRERLRARAALGLSSDRVHPAATYLADLHPWAAVVRALEAGGDLTLLGVRQVDGGWRARFRVTLMVEFDYHDYQLEPDAAGVLRVVDAHIYSRGELLSETLRRGLSLGERGRTALRKLDRHIREQNPSAGIALHDALPLLLRRGRDFQLRRAALAGQQSKSEWQSALALAEDSVGGDAVDYLHLAHGRHHEPVEVALAALERLEESTGDTAFAEYYRGILALEEGLADAARGHLERALRRESGYEDPLWALLLVHDTTGDFLAFSIVLDRLLARFGYDLEDLAEDPLLAGFQASPVYAEWVEHR
ncbi:MAG: hypothetical protein V3T22_13640 [Planctomycetota bacterium]